MTADNLRMLTSPIHTDTVLVQLPPLLSVRISAAAAEEEEEEEGTVIGLSLGRDKLAQHSRLVGLWRIGKPGLPPFFFPGIRMTARWWSSSGN